MPRDITIDGDGEPIGKIRSGWEDHNCDLCRECYGFNPGCDGCRLCRMRKQVEDERPLTIQQQQLKELEEELLSQGLTESEVHEELKGGGDERAKFK